MWCRLRSQGLLEVDQRGGGTKSSEVPFGYSHGDVELLMRCTRLEITGEVGLERHFWSQAKLLGHQAGRVRVDHWIWEPGGP